MSAGGRDLINAVYALLDAIDRDEGRNGGLLSRETQRAADELRVALSGVRFREGFGVISHAGELMPLAFETETQAVIESLQRWPLHCRGDAGVAAVIIAGRPHG